MTTLCRVLSISALLLASRNGFSQPHSNLHRVVIEVNTVGTVRYGFVLNNASNLLRAFAPEKVEMEIVCHGPGIDLLLAKGATAKRLADLQRKGVRFVACANTLKGRKIEAKSLRKGVIVVPSGVAELVRRQEAGWAYLKGAY